MTRPTQVDSVKAAIAQMPNFRGAAPVSISKNALIISAGAICQQKRISATLNRSINQSQGRKRNISQITRQAGRAGILFVNVVSVIVFSKARWLSRYEQSEYCIETTAFQVILRLH